MDIAKAISNTLAEKALVAKVRYTKRVATLDGKLAHVEDEDEAEEVEGEEGFELWDMTRPLEGTCDLIFLKFEDHEGKVTFWHSSAHVLVRRSKTNLERI